MRAARRQLLLRAASAAFFVGVLVASFMPPGIMSPNRWSFGHPLGYALLTVFVLLSSDISPQRRWRTIGSIVLGLSVLGSVIELAQPAVGRTASLTDLLYDLVGIGIGLAAYAFYLRWGREWSAILVRRVERHRSNERESEAGRT